MHRQHCARLHALDAALPTLHILSKVPQIKVDHYAAHSVHPCPTIISVPLFRDKPGNRAADAFHRDDARCADAQLLTTPRRERCPSLKYLDECGRVCEDAEVMQDLRHAVVGEHRELVYCGCGREKRVRRRWVLRVECSPCLRDEDLCALPDVYYITVRGNVRYEAECEYLKLDLPRRPFSMCSSRNGGNVSATIFTSWSAVPRSLYRRRKA